MTQKLVFAADSLGQDFRIPRGQVTATEADFADPSHAAPAFGVFEKPTFGTESRWTEDVESVAKEKGVDRAKINFGHDRTLDGVAAEGLISNAMAHLRKTCKASITLRRIYKFTNGGAWQLSLREDNLCRDFIAYLHRNLLNDESEIDGLSGIEGKALSYRAKCIIRIAFAIYLAWLECLRFGLGCDDKQQALAKYHERFD